MKTRRNFCTIIACGLLLAHFALCQTTESTIPTGKSTSQSSFSTIETVSSVETTNSTTASTTTAIQPNSSTTMPAQHKNSTANATETALVNSTLGNSTDNTTTSHSSTPIATTTTQAPPKNTWKVDKNGTVCLIVQLSATFHNDNHPKDDVKLENATEVASKSSCNDSDTQRLTLMWHETYSLVLEFGLSADKTQFSLNNLVYLNNTEEHSLNESSGLSAHTGKSYKCNAAVTKKLTGNVTVTLEDIQFQAFMIKTDEGKFGTAEECSSDTTSDVVPIAVGCALAGLVIVVLIAYLVGRRRSRQRGYQSV